MRGPRVVMTVEVPVSTRIAVDQLGRIMRELRVRGESLADGLADDDVSPASLVRVGVRFRPGKMA